MAEVHDYERFYGLYEGIVEEVDARHRVRASLTGGGISITDSGWLEPKGGGSLRRGGHLAPAVGGRVFIQFIGGDLQRGVWESASGYEEPDPDGGELPNDIEAAGAEGAKVQSLEVSDAQFAVRLTIDERDGKRAARAVAVVKDDDGTETLLGSIELDMEARVLTIFGLASVVVRSVGTVQIDGININVNQRIVRQGTAAPL